MARPPLLVAFALRVIRVVARLVPRRDREEWRREWTHELLSSRGAAASSPEPLRRQLSLFRHALGSLADAAWLRRQFTRDAEMLHDLRHTVRLLVTRPGSSLLAVAVLALGIGSATAVASVVDALLLREPPFPAHDRLVAIWEQDTSSAVPRREVAPANYLDWRDSATTVQHMASVEPWSVDYTGGARPEVILAAKVGPGFFDALRVTPLHGRLFEPEDYTVRKGQVVLLDHALWQQRFGGDPAVVGRSIPLDATPHVVVGVLPPAFRPAMFLSEGRRREAWLPQVLQGFERNSRESGWWAVIARLRDDVSLEHARAEFAGISARLASAHPRTNARVVARLDPIDEHVRSDVRPALVAMAGAVGLVLLIVCANVANLLLARGLEREREFAVRSALGAGRARLARQVIAESLLVSSVGTAAGILVAWGLVRGTQVAAPETILGLTHAAIDARVLFFAVALGIVTALGFGLAPAWQSATPAAGESLKAGRSTGTRRAGGLRDVIATIEVALAVIVVVGAGLLLRSFVALIGVDPGFAADRVAVMQVFAYDRDNQTPAKRIAFFRETIDRMRELPGVTRVGAVSAMPFLAANINIESTLTIEGRPPAAPGEAPRVFVSAATDDYFETMGMPLVVGRTLTRQDDARVEPVAVISQSLARRFWPAGEPLGAFATVRLFGPTTRVRIVGVVGDLRHDGYDAPPREELFVSQWQVGTGSMTYVLQTSGDPAAVLAPAQEVIWARDPLQTIYDSATVPELLSASVAPRRFALLVMSSFAVVALLLATAGIYGVMSLATRMRMREFGVRMALGASRREISTLVLKRGALLGLVGVAVGLATAVLGARVFSGLLFDIGAADPLALTATAAVVLAATLLASYAPARRATRVDPLAALRD